MFELFSLNEKDADDCFYRGGLFNWFEGGPVSAFLSQSSPGYQPSDGNTCLAQGTYVFYWLLAFISL